MTDLQLDIERERRVLEILDEVLDTEKGQRASRLSLLTASDPSLMREVKRLMNIGDSATDFDLKLPAEVFDEGMRTLGTLVGNYRLLRRIRAGGMGVVYEAEQVNPRRRVALKIVRADRLSQPALEQFLAEIRALGRLEHPGIARIYDAGFHAESSILGPREVPYMVMEFVRGETNILAYARDQALSIKQRLRMFAEVCRAIHFGHACGVFHMDIKPDNILVDEAGRPKVIDFGISHVGGAQKGPLGSSGTLEYMSPERLARTEQQPDASADVYALGVTLYQLVCGSHPLGLSGGHTERHQVRQLVEAREPTPPRSLVRIPRDLESVILAAIARDPAQRIQTVLDLGREIERFLDRRPVSTRPWSLLYATRKLVLRNRRITAAVVGGTILAVAGAVAFVRSRAHEKAAEQEVAQAETVLELMRAHAQVDTLLASIATSHAPDAPPPVTAGREEILGEIHTALGNRARALESSRRYVAALEEMHGEPHLSVALARLKLGQKLIESPLEVEAASREFQRVQEEFESLPHEESDSQRLREGLTQCALIEGRTADAARIFTGREQATEIPIPDLMWLARTAYNSGCFEVATDFYTRALERAEARDAGSLEAARCRQSLGGVLWRIGEYEQAEPLMRSALETYSRRLGPGASLTSRALNSLGIVLRDAGKLDEAESALGDALDVRRDQATVENEPDYRIAVAESFNNIGGLYLVRGDIREARNAFASALDQDVVDTFANSEALVGMGTCLIRSGRAELGQGMLELALEKRRRIYHDRHWLIGDATSALGESFVAQGNWRKGQPMLQEGLTILEESLGSASRMTVRAARRAELLK